MAVSGSWARVLGRSIGRLARDKRGATAVLFSFLLPVIVMAVGGALDYGYLTMQRAKLQSTSDAAVVAVARELHLAQTDPNHFNSAVKAIVSAHMGQHASGVGVSTTTSKSPMSVTVDLQKSFDGFFISHFKDVEIKARSVANVTGGTPLCVLGLGENARGTISLQASARLSGDGCAVYSNSTHSNGLIAKDSAELSAGLVCTAGGAAGGSGNYTPEPLTDCPPMEDPLANRPAPPIGSCVAEDLRIGVDPKRRIGRLTNAFGTAAETLPELFGRGGGGSDLSKTDSDPEPDDGSKDDPNSIVTLKPGTYCGDLIIGGSARVTLAPGEYVLRDGQLHVTDFASIEGENVGFYFHGTASMFFFGPNTTVNLTAPANGPMAGILFFENRNARKLRLFSMLSDNARLLEGTIYLPNALFVIDADRTIADKSAYTAIIAQRLALFAGPNLVLNTDYDATDVPVPAGIAHDRVIKIVE